MMSVIPALLLGLHIAARIGSAACDGSTVDSELVEMAAMLPMDETYYMYVNICTAADHNGDGMPELYLATGSGWGYEIYYVLNGKLCTVEGLEPWAWSNDLYLTTDGRLVLYTWPHTMGTAGNDEYRIFDWTPEGYCLTEQLWSEPEEWDLEAGTVLTCRYFSSQTVFDRFAHDNGHDKLRISQEEYERKIEELGNLTPVFGEEEILWDYTFWQENDDDESAGNEIYGEILDRILYWQ